MFPELLRVASSVQNPDAEYRITLCRDRSIVAPQIPYRQGRYAMIKPENARMRLVPRPYAYRVRDSNGGVCLPF